MQTLKEFALEHNLPYTLIAGRARQRIPYKGIYKNRRWEYTKEDLDELIRCPLKAGRKVSMEQHHGKA